MSKILDRINAGIEAYHKEVLAMSDRELYMHCYEGGDYLETDFCSQELKRRGMDQYNPQGWCYLQEMPAKEPPKVIAGSGVTHWLERQ